MLLIGEFQTSKNLFVTNINTNMKAAQWDTDFGIDIEEHPKKTFLLSGLQNSLRLRDYGFVQGSDEMLPGKTR